MQRRLTELEPVANPVRDWSEAELRHLARMLRGERRFAVLVAVDLGVAAALAGYWSWAGSWTATRAVLVVLILLSARGHLRQLRSARLLRKAGLRASDTAPGGADA